MRVPLYAVCTSVNALMVIYFTRANDFTATLITNTLPIAAATGRTDLGILFRLLTTYLDVSSVIGSARRAAI